MSFYSFKEILQNITCSTEDTIKFLQSCSTLQSSMICPGPLINHRHLNNCNKEMTLKKTNDRKDGVTWRCRKVHHVYKDNKKYTVKDVKLSIRTDTWISDSNISLQIIVELIYLWTQRFTNAKIQHELKLSPQTIIEWTAFFREVCLNDVFNSSEQIGGKGIEVEIDESKFGW